MQWTTEEKQFVIDNYRILTTQEIGDRLGRSHMSIESQISRLGLVKNFVKREPIKEKDYYLIPLYTNNTREKRYAKVDEENLEKVKSYAWSYNPQDGVRTTPKRGQNMLTMPNLILPPPEGMMVNHKNGDKLDNRLCNLRHVTFVQIMAKRSKFRSNTTSKYKGVVKEEGAWRVRVGTKSFGSFPTEIEAAKAYDIAAKQMYGDFTNLNFPDQPKES